MVEVVGAVYVFLGSGIYYFIMLKAKIDLLLQHVYR